jgi:regulation of enolase protein 1 (concanavalin A-like superfamily)
MHEPVTLPGLPLALHWQVPPERWHVGDDGSLSIVAGARTDLFVDPAGGPPTLNAPRLLGRPDGDFQLHARVRVSFEATFDAGVLLLYAHERAWAKLCFERSPQGEPLVVSVVTRGVSDDANAFAVDGDQVWLRVSRLGGAYAFHASTDGDAWRFVRHFALETGGGVGDVATGLLAQSPTGERCTALFDAVGYRPEPPADLRSGV